MSFFPKGLIAVSLGVFLLGLGLCLVSEDSFDGPPTVNNRMQKQTKGSPDLFPSAETLSGPWFQAPPPAIGTEVAKPAPVPEKVDSRSLTFLGSYKDHNGEPRFFFKFVPTGQVIILKPGEMAKGWLLKDVGDHKFTLNGPGGLYEVSH